MPNKTIIYKEWEFEVDIDLNQQTYNDITLSGADSCTCYDCKNFVALREKVFPSEVQILFAKLGIDYKKEVEIVSYGILPNGLHQIGGWFHFAGKVISGKSYKVPLLQGGHTYDLTKIDENFEIGFAAGNDLTFFANKEDLVQVEFMTEIRWVIDHEYETN